ncbi:site-specific recombinase XerD [Breznakia blatticola]|uniref:Site-specific recombinase XerD n=1 Tax=Breznakia blatticola TaxID=1754012 RepID=A0A4R7Z8Q1_9FIRM|nr:site-specific integrase [Breznakia blatticola]TDW13110.1 site-specific recombinase XerD [Breznakia blatticola]
MHKELLKEMMIELIEENPGLLQKTHINKELNKVLDFYWEKYMEHSLLNKEITTCENDDSIYRLHIKPFFGTWRLYDIKPDHIIQWQLEMKNNCFYTTLVNRYKVFNKFFNWINKIYDTKWNPVSRVGMPRRTTKKEEMKIWSEVEFYKFFSQITDLEHKAIFMLFYFAGLRRGELLALKWNDFRDNYIEIDESVANVHGKQKVKGPKNLNSYRLIEIDDSTKKILTALHTIAIQSDKYRKDNFIFGRQTRPMAFETLRKAKIRYEESAGLSHIRLHDLRHSHVSLLINNKIPVIAIAMRIGDSIDEVMKTYAHLLPESSLEVSNLLNSLTKRYF